MAAARSILFVDAYDSFTQNIVALLHRESQSEIVVIRTDTDVLAEHHCSLDAFIQRFDAVVLGPGPGDPRNGVRDTGHFQEAIKCAAQYNIPILGICLGFQCLCLSYGLTVQSMGQPCHGHPKQILQVSLGPPADVPENNLLMDVGNDNICATCYNSLSVTLGTSFKRSDLSRPSSSSTISSLASASSRQSSANKSCYSDADSCLKVLAIDSDDNVMAVMHKSLPAWGFQFHPESCKSNDACHQLLRNWLAAVASHNQLRRPDRLKNVQIIHSRQLECSAGSMIRSVPGSQQSHNKPTWSLPDASHRTKVWTAMDIQNELLACTWQSGSTVHYTVLRTSYSRDQISRLIRITSSAQRTSMLESSQKGRYSIYACSDRALHTPDEDEGNALNIDYLQEQLEFRYPAGHGIDSIKVPTRREHLLEALEKFMASKQAKGGSSGIPFWGGFIGYLSYETGLDGLETQTNERSDRQVPDISLLWVDRSIVYDAKTSTVYVQSIRKNDEKWIAEKVAFFTECTQLRLAQDSETQAARKAMLSVALESAQICLPNQREYEHCYKRCQAELLKGNSYELCLTTEVTISITTPPRTGTTTTEDSHEFELYQNLIAHNPVPFSAYLSYPSVTILSTSPEQYISWDRTGIIDMIPMKGTVKRTPNTSLASATAILSTPKETAENLMIADLIRHDLYTAVGHTSEVEVVKLCEVVEHETVYQLVSHIRAHAPIPPDCSEYDKSTQAMRYGLRALRTSLPPGSMTGAPKKRSCEILHDIEARNRGVYSGVLGYLDVGGGGCWSVCIRTAFRAKSDITPFVDESGRELERHTWRIGAGGAITVLSTLEGEWEEMNVKLKSVLRGFKEVK